MSRKLTVTGGDVEISGTGSATITFPTTSTTIAGLSIAQTFTVVQGFAGGFTAAGATFTNAIYAPNMVTGVNGITGAVSLTSGSGITITQTGKQITVASSITQYTAPLATSSITGVASFRADDFDVSTTGSVSLTGTVAKTNTSQTYTGMPTYASGISSAGATFGGTVNMTTNIIRDLEMRDYYESLATPTFSSGVLTCDLNASQVFNHTLSASITSIVLQNVPPKANTSIGFTLVIKQGATGGLTATFTGISGATALFPGGTAPTMSSAANKTDIVSYISYDNGSNWFGFVGGQAF